MKKITIIPARSGSKGVPNKNIRHLHGKPLMVYTIIQALESNIFEHVVVSTDSEEIAEMAKYYGAEKCFLRPPELATDEAGSLGVIQHALKWAENEDDKKYKYIVKPYNPNCNW